MIGSVADISGYLAYGGAGWAGYSLDFGGSGNINAGAYSSQPFDTRGATLQALANGGSEIDRITAALTKLRNALQATRDQSGFTAGSTDLRAIVTSTGQGASRDSLSAAGINSGDSFTVQVGGGSVATITFKSAKQIDLMIGGATQSFTFNATDGSWQTGLVNALNSIANVSAALTGAGGLSLQTTNGKSLTIAAPSAANDPLAEIGLTAGTTYAGNDASALVEAGTSQITLGSNTAVVGYDRVNRQAINVGDAARALASATLSLSASAGADASGLATDLSALLQSGDLQAAINRTDPTAIDNTLVRIDAVLAKAESLRVPVSFNQSAASRVDLSGLLLDSGLQTASSSTAGISGGSAYTASSSYTSGSQFSSLA